MRLTPVLHLLRLGIVAYVVALFGAALWAAWSFLNGVVREASCPDGDCSGRGVAGLSDWLGAVGPGELAAAGLVFTGTVILGMVLFALPWWAYRVWLQWTGRFPRA